MTAKLQLRQVGLDMGLLGFQIRPVPGPETFDLGDLNGPKPVQNTLKVVGHKPPHHFSGCWTGLGPLRPPKSTISDPETVLWWENPTILFLDLHLGL